MIPMFNHACVFLGFDPPNKLVVISLGNKKIHWLLLPRPKAYWVAGCHGLRWTLLID